MTQRPRFAPFVATFAALSTAALASRADASFAPTSYDDEPAPADEPTPSPHPPRFGDAGTFAVSSSASSLFVSHESYADSPTRRDERGVDLALDYFAFPHFSIGIFGFAASSHQTGYDPQGDIVTQRSSSYGAGVRFGGDVPIGSFLSLWTRIGFGSSTIHVSLGDASDDESAMEVEARVLLLVHPVPHFFVGAGPQASHDLLRSTPDEGDHRRTFVEATFVLGGWF